MTDIDDTTIFDAVNAANGIDSYGFDQIPEPTPTPTPTPTPNFGQKTGDPEAPYGRTKSGVPRRKPGRPRTSSDGPTTPRPTKRTGPRQSSQKTGTDYRPGILGLLQFPAFALGAAGQLNEDLALDGAAISMHAPGIAEALNDLADANPAVAAALDRILSVGPYGAIIGACLPLAMQILANHKRIPDGVARGGGAVPRDDFRALLLAGHPS